ncbi:hypothetical protein P7C71_g1576, partial [Lecanoromycetidae sp. Uapishka_2]
MEQSNHHLPRILCLHGGGTSAMIFKIQTRRLQSALRSHFRFVFVDAPFESGPGPGVLPVFEGCEPFYRWVVPDDQNQERGQMHVRQMLREAIKSDEGDGEFVGVLGFSQGGRMAAGLLADLQEGEATGLPYWQFGVFICASYPPLSMSSSRPATSKPTGEVDGHGPLRDPDEDEIIHVPSIHVRGTLDPHLEKGRRLQKYFNEKTRFILEFEMGHHLPGAAGDTTSRKGDTDEIRDAILRAFRSEQHSENAKHAMDGIINGQEQNST